MNKLANIINKGKKMYQKNKLDIAIITMLVLVVLLVVGVWRLSKVKPEKRPITIEEGI